jgi:urease accessory protein
MRSCSELVASAPLSPARRWRLSWARGMAPLAFRETPEAVYLVGTAASPVSDDEVSLSVRVEPGAQLVVRSAASSIAWAGRGASLEVTVELGEGASLDWRLRPLVATSRCDFSQHVRLELAPGASLSWAEEVVLGRHSERPGNLRLRLDADVDGRPLLRHALAVGPNAPGWDGPAVLGCHRAVGLVLVAGPGTERGCGSRSAGGDWARLELEGPAVLFQAVGKDLPALREALVQARRERPSPDRQRAPA